VEECGDSMHHNRESDKHIVLFSTKSGSRTLFYSGGDVYSVVIVDLCLLFMYYLSFECIRYCY
jgi:hypothetical protein